LPHLATRAVLTAIAVLCTAAAPALAHALGSPGSAAPAVAGAHSTGGPVEASAAMTVRFKVRPVIVVVVDDAGTPTQVWTNVPGAPTAAELDAVQVRLDDPRGPALPIDPALDARLPAVLGGAGWGHQGLIWQRG
jgi:hypothetical protein